MIVGIKQMIARCIARMRQKECATCDNRALCPAGRWQALFADHEKPEPDAAPLRTFLGELAGAFQRGTGKPSLQRQVEAAIEPLLAGGEATIERVARDLGMSRQTLYRRLKTEGLTFEQLLDGLRHRLALRLIRDQQLPVKQASWRLGFSDPAAFSRAFKRWTGASPSAARA